MGTKNRKKKVVRQEELFETEDLPIPLATRLKNNLHAFLITLGMEAVEELLEEERVAICGPAHARDPNRTAYRSGHAPGELIMGGRRVRVRRPRARTMDGQEAPLPSWQRFGQEDPLNHRAVEQMVVGVSTRKYERSLEEVDGPLKVRGTSKSAVSRRFVATTAQKFKAWMSRDLSQLDLVALMIDGIEFAEHTVLIALGIDLEGTKHVLGIWEGSTENASVCRSLLMNLQQRGLSTERSILAVIDGSKALAKAIRNVFGPRALIQRCRVHKLRNVRDHLPDEMRPSVKATMNQAYASKDVDRAERLLKNLAKKLEDEHPGASASILEGLEETLTVKRLGLTGQLERILSTTNAIENLNGTARNISRRVKRWRGGKMILRWVATSMIEAEKKFRRIQGCKKLPELAEALRENDQQIDGVDRKDRVA